MYYQITRDGRRRLFGIELHLTHVVAREVHPLFAAAGVELETCLRAGRRMRWSLPKFLVQFAIARLRGRVRPYRPVFPRARIGG